MIRSNMQIYAIVLLLLLSCFPKFSVAADPPSSMERWRTLPDRINQPIFGKLNQPQWLDESKGLLTYRVQIDPTTYKSVLIDAINKTREERSDDDQHNQLAAMARIQPSRQGGQATQIRFDNQTDQTLVCKWVTTDSKFRDYGKIAAKTAKTIFTYAGHSWVLESVTGKAVATFVANESQSLARIDTNIPEPTGFVTKHSNRTLQLKQRSPDDRFDVELRKHNVWLKDRQSDTQRRLTHDGTATDAYGGSVWWSPDSKFFVVMKTQTAETRTIAIIESSPADSIHASLSMHAYAKPGDDVDSPSPVLFSIESGTATLVDNALFPNPYSLGDVQWAQDSGSFSFLYNERGHQRLRVIRVDAATGHPRIVIDETSETFVCYSQKKYFHRISKTNEIIWMSERSGWNHLYLIDGQTGEVKNPITAGDWVVRGVEKIDETTRQAWLRVCGIDADQDPYHQHLIRVDFEGTNLVRLTHGDGEHQWQFSPNHQYVIDTYSRVDLPPRSDLRDAQSGVLIMHLEQADASALLETGWRFPERFVAKGRDGTTDIHGIIIRPTNFDAAIKYPVLESIYAGPHGAFVPKQFGRHQSLYKMAELGFVVVKIDAMGTNFRSKAFHDVCWKNLADSGFPDRIAWIKAAANDRPEMDITRVGIFGGSAGGQSAMRALIAHHDFYDSAVADCGCHDNRVDKIWWNEQWMGYPIGPHYEQQSNVTQAHRMRGNLMLIVGERDTNVDPISTMQVVDALIKADKDFEMLVMPGVGHGAAGHPYAQKRQAQFLIRNLKP